MRMQCFSIVFGGLADKGIPLLETVQLGNLQDKKTLHSGDGHMRLIIGDNAKPNGILFSE